MGTMQEFESTSTLFGSNAPFIEELYETYLADPAVVEPRVAQLFRRAAAADDGRRRVRTARSVESFRELARNRRVAGRWSTRRPVRQAGARAAADQQSIRTLGMLHADARPAEAAGAAVHPRARPAHYGFTDADLDTRVRRRLVQGWAGADARCATSSTR